MFSLFDFVFKSENVRTENHKHDETNKNVIHESKNKNDTANRSEE